jgi:transcriptional regulator with XRE-family HTH domain
MASPDIPKAAPVKALAAFRAAFTAHRLAAGLSTRQLSRMAGLSATAVQGWENGRTAPNIKSLYRVAFVLRVPLATLIGPLDKFLAKAAENTPP